MVVVAESDDPRDGRGPEGDDDDKGDDGDGCNGPVLPARERHRTIF